MGTSILNTPYRMPTQDHPHAYGDKLYSIVVPLDENGSSPRVWGQALVKPLCCAGKRIIPTRMGTRISHSKSAAMSGDHPHAYGDKTMSLTGTKTLSGSSPRVWGQAGNTQKIINNKRIIPTRMGTRNRPKGIFRFRQDHPHAYGDKMTQTLDSLYSQGSSPRVWGQVVDSVFHFGHFGIIPTRMGTSEYGVSSVCHRRDHPHAYGDKTFYI